MAYYQNCKIQIENCRFYNSKVVLQFFLTKHSKLLSVLDKEVSLNVVWQAIQNQVREAVLHEIECFMEMQSGLFCKPDHMMQGEGEGTI